jgi:GntR family transcriptional regulator
MGQFITKNLSGLLDRSVGGPSLYYQIIEVLERLIQNREIRIGEYLPSQDELARLFNVSRITIRNALQELNNKGFVISERAKGARVLKYPEKKSLYHGIGFSDFYQEIDEVANTKIISLDFNVINSRVARKLSIDENIGMIMLKRLRIADEIPIALETAYLPADRKLIDAFEEFTDQSSLYTLLQDTFDIRIGFVEERLKAELCKDQKIQNLLEIGADPILFTMRRSYEKQGGLPLEYCESYIGIGEKEIKIYR